MTNGFMGSNYIPEKGSEEAKAISRLKMMTVYQVMNSDHCYYHSFDDVWYSVYDEAEIYREYVNKGGQSEYNEFIGKYNKGLNWMSYHTAVEWLRKYAHLVTEKPFHLLGGM